MAHIYRLQSGIIANDRTALLALQKLSNYAPHNPAYSNEALTVLGKALDQALQNEILAQHALAAARDATVAAEWALHEAILGCKTEVLAQYGPDSDAIQSLGLKKRSKYRRSAARPAKNS